MNEVYVIGCGPSMKTFDWSKLRGRPTIAVNGAVISVPEPKVFLTACSGFAMRAFRNDFWNTKARKVLVIAPDHRGYSRIKSFIGAFDEVHKPARYNGQIGFTWDAFATGQNSGFSAMQYSVIQGATSIHLVGFDLIGHGHNYDINGPTAMSIREFHLHFVTGIRVLQEHGIHVISHTKVSSLNQIIPYEEL